MTAADLPPDVPPIPCRIPTHGHMEPFLQPVLARDIVRYVGEPVAVIVAASRALAEDAAELIVVEWEPLPAVTDTTSATLVHAAGNIASQWASISATLTRQLRNAAVTVTETFAVQRHTAMPLETRGLLASYDRARRMLEVFGPTKVPHTNRNMLAAMLQMSEAEVRFIEPDVGGSFGARGEFYPEDFLDPLARDAAAASPCAGSRTASSTSHRSTIRAR